MLCHRMIRRRDRRPRNCSWSDFYDRVIDLTTYSFSWKVIARRFRATRGPRARGMRRFRQRTISAFNPLSGVFLGTISDSSGIPIVNDVSGDGAEPPENETTMRPLAVLVVGYRASEK